MTEKCRNILFKNIAPAVINNDMIMKAIDEQRPSGEAGRLAREDDIAVEEVTSIRLEFLHILRIDFLWILTGLTKLSLSNNVIEKIENLSTLIHLKELDLSFNQIEVIENLEELTLLETLTLYCNKIEKIEHLDTLRQLHVFSIGKNHISDRENVFHLRKFKKLRSVNMEDNPCAYASDFRYFIATFLPQIAYYEYRRISGNDRSIGYEIFKDQLRQLIKDEATEVAREEKEENERLEAELHAESFVEFLGERQLFDSLFEKDPDGKLLLLVEGVPDLYTEYEVAFLEVTRKLFEVGQRRFLERKSEVDQFNKCVETAKEDSQMSSQQVMEQFIGKKAKLINEIKTYRATFTESVTELDFLSHAEFIQEYIDMFDDLLHGLWKKLMYLEMTLFDQLEEINLNFERALTELVTTFIEEAQGFFTSLRGFETNYMESVLEATLQMATTYQGHDSIYILEELKGMCEDKEVLNNVVASSHDIHMQLIDGREDRLVSRAKLWLQNLVNNLQKNEIQRNRNKVLEINHFMDCQREELEEIYNETPGLNEDISAALA